MFKKSEESANEQSNNTLDDELFLLQHARLENSQLNNEYGDDNELDLALAIEMSMLSDPLYLSSTKNQEVSTTSNNLFGENEKKNNEIVKKNENLNVLPNNPPPGFHDSTNDFNNDLVPPGFSKLNNNITKESNQESINNVEDSKSCWTDIMESLFRTKTSDK